MPESSMKLGIYILWCTFEDRRSSSPTLLNLYTLAHNSTPYHLLLPVRIPNYSPLYHPKTSILDYTYISTQEGCFPHSFKTPLITPLVTPLVTPLITPLVTPLVKKPNLDPSNLSNYRPISNLNNISKSLEKRFLSRLQPHILTSPMSTLPISLPPQSI